MAALFVTFAFAFAVTFLLEDEEQRVESGLPRDGKWVAGIIGFGILFAALLVLVLLALFLLLLMIVNATRGSPLLSA
jgi:hypothetical protein